MNSVTVLDASGKIIVGVDTHKHLHVAVAIDSLGVRLGDVIVAADTGGYRQLAEWVHTWGDVEAFGIDGTGSYGAGLASYLRRQGHRIVEVNRGDRRARRERTASLTLSTPKPLPGRCSMEPPLLSPSLLMVLPR